MSKRQTLSLSFQDLLTSVSMTTMLELQERLACALSALSSVPESSKPASDVPRYLQLGLANFTEALKGADVSEELLLSFLRCPLGGESLGNER